MISTHFSDHILLLGAYGFIGTNLMKFIDSNGLNYRVITYDRTKFHPKGISFDCIIDSYAGDFADEAALDEVFTRYHIDIVVHCISTTIPAGNQSTLYDIESNLLPSIKLLDVMLSHHCQRIVFISSGGAVYGESDWTHSERDAVFPKSSYGVVKVAIEKCLFQYSFTYGLKPLVIRLSNPYGRFNFSARQGLINTALIAAKKGQIFNVWGDGSATKDYIYVDDFCRILFELVSQESWGEMINVGSGYLYSVNQILSIIKLLYPGFAWEYTPANKNDVSFLSLDLTKLHSRIDLSFHRIEEVISDIAKHY